MVDVTYDEDSRAEGDFNFVLSHDGGIIEIQGTAEKRPIPQAKYDECWVLAQKALKQIMSAQNIALIKG